LAFLRGEIAVMKRLDKSGATDDERARALGQVEARAALDRKRFGLRAVAGDTAVLRKARGRR
jgi:hypothetical protein